jgi:phosphocarrier protein
VTESGEQNSIVACEFEILNQYGIHARPASLIVKTASRFDADIYIEKDGNRVSGKSMLGLMTLEASRGSKLRITVEGVDAEEAMGELQALFESKFDEG